MPSCEAGVGEPGSGVVCGRPAPDHAMKMWDGPPDQGGKVVQEVPLCDAHYLAAGGKAS